MPDLLFMEQVLIISKHQHITGLNLVHPVSVGISNHCLKLFFSPSRAKGIFAVYYIRYIYYSPAIVSKQNAFIEQIF